MKLSSLSVAAALAAIAGTTIASGPPHEHRHRGRPAHGEAPPAYSEAPPAYSRAPPHEHRHSGGPAHGEAPPAHSEAPPYSGHHLAYGGHPPAYSGPLHLQGGPHQSYGLPNPHTHRQDILPQSYGLPNAWHAHRQDGPSQSYGLPNPHAHRQEPQGGLPHHDPHAHSGQRGDPPQLHGPSNPHGHGLPRAQGKPQIYTSAFHRDTVVAYKAHLSTADHWQKAAAQAKRLSTENRVPKFYTKEYLRAEKQEIRYRDRASLYRDAAIIYRQGSRNDGTVEQQNLARNALPRAESAQRSLAHAQRSIEQSSADLRSLGINFEAEEAARRGAARRGAAGRGAEEAVRKEALDGLLSLYAGLHG